MKSSGAAEFFRDLISMRWYLAVSLLLFAGGFAFGGAASDALGAQLENALAPLRGTVERMEALGHAQVRLFVFIFINNFLKAILAVFLGALFGLFPVVFLVSNGMLLGYVVASIKAAGLDVADSVIRGLLPHGVLEIFAILVAAAYGLRYGVLVGSELVTALRRRGYGGSGGKIREFHAGLKRLAAFLFFALLTAAFIESTVTYMLVRG